MAWRPPPPCGCGWMMWLLLAFLLAGHGAGAGAPPPAPAAPAPRLSPAEARVLDRIAAKLGVPDLAAAPCNHAGVDCQCPYSSNNQTVCHVVRIVLNGYNFSGELPTEFADLPHLGHLDLSRSLFHGGVPDQWAQMKLILLLLMGNRLSGPFPMVLTKITTLIQLDIEGNGFYGPIPPEVGQLMKLVLSTNEFTGPLPADLSLLTNLTDLRISSNNLSGRLPDFWENLAKLQTLEIEGSLLDGPIPPSLSKLTNLTDLRISDLRGSGSSFPDLSGMSFLKKLVLRNCSISGSIPSYIGTWRTLKHLDLSFNKLSGQIPDSFAQMERVDYIYLTGNSLTGNIPGWLLRRNKIAHFNVSIEVKKWDISFNNFTMGSSGPSPQCPIGSTVNLVESFSPEMDSLNSVQSCLKRNFPCVASNGQYKADVYSFGVVALEVVSGKSNTNYRPKEECVYLLDWACVLQERGTLLELVDPDLGSNYSTEEALLMLNVALLCTTAAPTLRPKMSEVVSLLEGHIPLQPLLSDLGLAANRLSSRAVCRSFWQNLCKSQSSSTAICDDAYTSSSTVTDDCLAPLVS